MFCWCSHCVYDSINSQLSHGFNQHKRCVRDKKYVPSTTAQLHFGCRARDIGVCSVELHKQVLPECVRDTQRCVQQPLKETCKVQDFVKMQWTWMRWKQEGYVFYQICRYIWYGCESFEWRMAWVFYVLWLALLMETVGSRNQQASRDQKPAKERILADHT